MAWPEFLNELTTPPRPAVLESLNERPYYVSELANFIPKSKASISRHLGTLETLGLVEVTATDRKWKYFRLTRGGEAGLTLLFPGTPLDEGPGDG